MSKRTVWYAYNEDTGMEYEHDGANTRSQWHDGVGLVTKHRQTFAAFERMCDDMDIDMCEVDG